MYWTHRHYKSYKNTIIDNVEMTKVVLCLLTFDVLITMEYSTRISGSKEFLVLQQKTLSSEEYGANVVFISYISISLTEII